MHGGALLGVAYRTSRRVTPMAATAISTLQSMPLSGFGSNGAYSSFSAVDSSVAEAALQNFQLYRCKRSSLMCLDLFSDYPSCFSF